MVAVTAGELSPIVDWNGLLQHDRLLAERVRAAPRPRVDRGPGSLVRAPARHGRPHRRLPGASSRDHAVAGRLGRSPRGGATSRRAFRGRGAQRRVCGKAYYRQGEVHRLRGERSAAEDMYREASRRGYEPQPGLALLRLAEGKGDAASSAIRRVLDEASQARVRAALLPAYVEIMLAGGEVEEARSACRELETIAGAHRSDMLAGDVRPGARSAGAGRRRSPNGSCGAPGGMAGMARARGAL